MEHLDHDHEHESYTHAHEHTRADENGAYTHSHDHTHGGHDHSHDHAHAAPGEQTVAVLRYMLDHNIHHAKELSDMAEQFDGEARHQLLHAVESFDQANGYLSAALEEIGKQSK